MSTKVKLADVSQRGVTAYVDSFYKALALYRQHGEASMSELFMARVYQRNVDEADTYLGAAYCRMSVSEGKTRISYLFAFDKETVLHHASLTEVRLRIITEGSLFNYGGEVWRLLHGRIIVPPIVMDTETVATIFNRQGICRPDGMPITAADVRIGRISFIYDHEHKIVSFFDIRNKFLNLTPEHPELGIGVVFFVETIIDGVEQIVFVRAFRGRHMRSAKWYPKALTVIREYSDRDSFRSSDGEWVLLNGQLTTYEKWVEYLRAKEEQQERKRDAAAKE